MLQNALHHAASEAGCDEAGRGCLAGPVVAAAVILPSDFHHPLLNDSKLLSEQERNILAPIIRSAALAWATAFCTPAEVDRINILRASFLAMHRAIARLSVRPKHLLIDGNRFIPYQDITHTCIVKGDSKFASIAAASVLAKTTRDQYMEILHRQHPLYNWESNKGYPTSAHRDAIRAHGPSEHHRKSFRMLPETQVNLFK
jgi:ribonuclease HII